ncbi:MAG: YidC/Oxa1 family insertase periplasmic-domain containing protein [Bacteroidetes bacterium]|nr:YidC/Oxa1 family insertase periplasmic-domain containing protein [Bacteroidota bacterium]
MPGFNLMRFLLPAAVFFLIRSCLNPVDSYAQTDQRAAITTPTVQLGWAPNQGDISTWNVLAGKSGNTDSWHPMITTAGNGVILSQHLRLQGSIHGELVHGGTITKTGLHLQQVFEKSGQPYCFKMVISITNRSGTAYVPAPADDLALTLGPGMGEKLQTPSVQSSNYTYVEPVASWNGKVTSYRDGTTQPRILGWKSPDLCWAGLHDRYFALLILPAEPAGEHASLPFTRAVVKFNTPAMRSLPPAIDLPMLFFKLPVTSLAPGSQMRWEFLVFSGPKSQATLSSAPVNLNSLLFAGLWNWMRWICFGLLWLLTVIHMIIPGWGWSIIVLAFIVRILLSPFAKKALVSQQRFVEAQKMMLPELAEIKKNWKGGEQSERILQLFKSYNVSPLAGLKPLLIVLIQLPVLIGLFQVLGAAYELHDAGFLWIRTLAEPDKLFSFGFNIPLLGSYFNILPVLMAVVTLLSFKLSPAPTAEKKGQLTQNLFLVAMTLMFFLLFYSFPAGMVLYWTFANVFHIVQHRWMLWTAK